MIFKREPGIITDSVQMLTIFFNREYYTEKISKSNHDLELELRIFDKYIKIFEHKIPKYLSPFFYCDGNISSLINLILDDYLSEDRSDFNEFLQYIKDNISVEKLLTHYFGDDFPEETSELINKIFEYNIKDSIKLSFIFCINNFDSVIIDVTNILKTSYSVACDFHNENADLVKEIYEKINSDSIKDSLCLCLGTDKESIEKSVCSISLAAPSIMICKPESQTDAMLIILGEYCQYAIDSKISYSNVSIETLSEILYNPLKRTIVEYLCKNKEINPTVAAKITWSSPSTSGRTLTAMLGDSILYISRKTKLSVYYSLREEYLLYAKKYMIDYLSQQIELYNTNVKNNRH